jgi:hypothetical protein
MQPYVPETLPPDRLDWTKLVRLIGQANAELARYDGILQGIVNPQVLLSPLTTQEAVLSSKIEGTQTSLEEVLQYEAGQEAAPDRQDDLREVLNYRRAMSEAVLVGQKHDLVANKSHCRKSMAHNGSFLPVPSVNPCFSNSKTPCFPLI